MLHVNSVFLKLKSDSVKTDLVQPIKSRCCRKLYGSLFPYKSSKVFSKVYPNCTYADQTNNIALRNLHALIRISV